MTDLLPARRPAGLTAGARWGIALATGVTFALVMVHLQSGQSEPPLRVRPVGPADITVVNPATVAVAVQVTNIGAAAALPTCVLAVQDRTRLHHGSGMFSVRDPIAPGRSTSFTARLQVTGLGAADVTQATAVCR